VPTVEDFQKRVLCLGWTAMSAHERTDIALTDRIGRSIFALAWDIRIAHIHAELADDHKIRVGRKRVARLMRIAGIRGATRGKFSSRR